MKLHKIHLKNRTRDRFAVALINAEHRPKNDLELIKAVSAAGGALVASFDHQPPFNLQAPTEISAAEFERNWLGD